jgi:hypothetical protein
VQAARPQKSSLSERAGSQAMEIFLSERSDGSHMPSANICVNIGFLLYMGFIIFPVAQ